MKKSYILIIFLVFSLLVLSVVYAGEAGIGLKPKCGDTITQPAGADEILNTEDDEECDMGLGNDDTKTCNTHCKDTYCGDGHFQTINLQRKVMEV